MKKKKIKKEIKQNRTIKLDVRHIKFIKKHNIQLSKFVRSALDALKID